MEEILYQFLYNPMIHESGYITMSIHRTRKGAEMALEFHKAEMKKEWNKMYDEPDEEPWKFGHFEDWKIEEIKLQD
jgi:hypothetical protein